MARHWVPTRHLHPEGEYLISQRDERLPRLREITPSVGALWQHIRKALREPERMSFSWFSSHFGPKVGRSQAYNPMSLLFFSVLQGCYFVGPAAIPAILYALARKPRYRAAAGSALGFLGLLALWPMHTERPYRTGGTAIASFMQRWLRERLLRYFSFQAIFEELTGMATITLVK